jgi:hypothetical protein
MDWTGALTWWGGWVPAFVLTCVIEVPVYLVMFELFGLAGAAPIEQSAGTRAGGTRAGDIRAPVIRVPSLGWPQAIVLALVLNIATHPVFWAYALRIDSTLGQVLAELVVTLAEGLIIWAVVGRRPLACLTCALVANAASAVLGTAISPFVISWAS